MALRLNRGRSNSSRPATITSLLLGLLLATAACSNSDDAPPIGPAPEPVVGAADSLPGVVVTIEAVRGGSGVNGVIQVGDTLEVDFTVKTDAGDPLELANFARGAIMVSGPTFNYQRVIGSQSDLISASTKRALGAYTYTFSVAVPATYLAPLNDTASFTTGELTGQALLAGTYTVGIETRKDYTVDGTLYRDPGDATLDFLFGAATTLEPRQVVTLANCNQCHSDLRVHGTNRTRIENCLLCHTAGSEDGNSMATGGGTPGMSVDFRVMIHKIHAGANLPSVNGVTTNMDGTRNYAATPQPYILQGFMASLHDFSDVVLPIWPSLAYPMPRDIGWGSLTSGEQSLENTMRSAPVDCQKCHGDPDGAGPLTEPAQGMLAYQQPTRSACGSCHDDIVWEHAYISNAPLGMPPQLDDATCKDCHRVSGASLDVVDAHRHPLADPGIATGVMFDIATVTDIGVNPSNGQFEAGEKVQVAMTIKDNNLANLPATSLSRIEVVLNGPTTNPNLVHFTRVEPSGLGAGPIYTFNLPQRFYYEPAGISMGSLETFATAPGQPHWNVGAAATTVLLATGTTTITALAADAPAQQNYIDVTPMTGAGFADDDYIVIENLVAGRREILRIQRVEGDRFWFSSAYSPNYAPSLRFAHAINSMVEKVTTIDVPSSSYTLDAGTGMITETTEFGTGEVLVTYTSDFLVPDNYPGAFNESPDLDQTAGDWVGLPLLSGTYNLGIYGRRSVMAGVGAALTSYNDASSPEVVQLLFGTATTVETVARIDGAAACYSCHNDIQFHGGGRRGVDTCLLCHGTAGAEDSPTYVYPTAAPTTGVSIEFRNMLHKIHHGKELSAGANYVVNGFGGNGHSYEHVGFPVMPGGTKDCASCHGQANDAWVEPADRFHPGAALLTRSWGMACGSCHDSISAQAHIDVNSTIFGAEACDICHGVGKENDVRTAHKSR